MEERQTKILKDMKVDIQPTLNRFVDSEEFYFEMLDKLSTDGTAEKLEEHIAAKDFAEAFKDAHTLKGVSANLGLGLLNGNIEPLTEALRHPPYDEGKITQLYQATKETYQECIRLIREIQ